MMKLIFLWIQILVSSFGFGASTYHLPRLENITINEFGICKKVINNGSNNYIVPTGIATDWSAFILHVPSDLTLASCSNDCVGSWGACIAGTQTYTITSPATSGGAACPSVNGATVACGTNCVGSWSACVNGTQVYSITTPSSGGLACPNNDGDTKTCGPVCHVKFINTNYVGGQNAPPCTDGITDDPKGSWVGAPNVKDEYDGKSCNYPGEERYLKNCWLPNDGFRAYCDCY